MAWGIHHAHGARRGGACENVLPPRVAVIQAREWQWRLLPVVRVVSRATRGWRGGPEGGDAEFWRGGRGGWRDERWPWGRDGGVGVGFNHPAVGGPAAASVAFADRSVEDGEWGQGSLWFDYLWVFLRSFFERNSRLPARLRKTRHPTRPMCAPATLG